MNHIERLRNEPPHVKHRIALLTSGGITGLVALGWLVAITTSGTLAIKESPILADTAQSGTEVREAFAESRTAFSELMGAAGAAVGATTSEPALTIVDTRASSTMEARVDNATDRTVIPF